MATIFIFDLITTIDKNLYVIYNILYNQGVFIMSNENQKDNKENFLTKFLKAIHEYYIFSFIFLFSLSIIIFAIIYICHSKNIENRFNNTLQNYEKSMSAIFNNMIIDNGNNENIYTNSFQTNNEIRFNNKIENLKLSFEVGFKMLESSINEIMKNSNDILQFWFAFLSVIMIVFTIIGFFLNNNILENAKKQLEMVEKEARTSRENIEKETNKLIEENNKNINITNLFNMSNQADDNRNYNLSINYLTEIIKIYEDDFNNKKYDEKSDNYDKAKKNCAVAYNNRGNAKSDLAKAKGKNNEEYDKLLNDAVEDYNKAIKLYSKNSIAFYTYYNRGNAKRLLLKIEEAIEDYSKAIELNPNFEGAYFNRGISKSDLSILIKKDNKIEEYNKLVNEAYNDFKTACSLANSELKKELINRIIVLAQNNDEVAIKFCEEHNINYNDNKE
ncbi:tetratricopeptide repeat protein [Brachyspira aalborgi]|uniref:Tetratricopeptide repeat protein n=2 Tax=Brachyspira aalborgi TaxID=29522 RepID=A0AB38PTE4_9SPIR|nr:tetratricopeptide repeat protein [Brachyspira aalborgi]TXJ32208.1 tetratricopeptide repeat protein [Brachyspira aalborgi]TXJ42567.1 tetratricopeptide repeat protein [Brachyspira aalborgi]CCY74958.1 tPR domain-containing protein [Brachyspira sp. CAG:700]